MRIHLPSPITNSHSHSHSHSQWSSPRTALSLSLVILFVNGLSRARTPSYVLYPPSSQPKSQSSAAPSPSPSPCPCPALSYTYVFLYQIGDVCRSIHDVCALGSRCFLDVFSRRNDVYSSSSYSCNMLHTYDLDAIYDRLYRHTHSLVSGRASSNAFPPAGIQHLFITITIPHILQLILLDLVLLLLLRRSLSIQSIQNGAGQHGERPAP